MATNAQQVARWMLSEFEKAGELYRSDAVDGIEREFGLDFIYDNDLGNQAIDRTVLVAFRKLTEGNVVWNRSEFCWQRKAPGDKGRLAE